MKNLILLFFGYLTLAPLIGQYNLSQPEFPFGDDKGKKSGFGGLVPNNIYVPDIMPHYLVLNDDSFLQVQPNGLGKMRLIDSNFELRWEVDFPEANIFLGKGVYFSCKVLSSSDKYIFQVDANVSMTKWVIKIVNIETQDKIVKTFETNDQPFFKNFDLGLKTTTSEGLYLICYNPKIKDYQIALIDNSGSITVSSDNLNLGEQKRYVGDEHKIHHWNKSPDGIVHFNMVTANKKEFRFEHYQIESDLSIKKQFEIKPRFNETGTNLKSWFYIDLWEGIDLYSYVGSLYSKESGPQNKNSFTNNYIYGAIFKNGKFVDGIDGPLGDFNSNSESTTIFDEHPFVFVLPNGEFVVMQVHYINFVSSSFGHGGSQIFEKTYNMYFNQSFEQVDSIMLPRSPNSSLIDYLSPIQIILINSTESDHFSSVNQDDIDKLETAIKTACPNRAIAYAFYLGKKLVVLADTYNIADTKVFVME